MEHMRCHLILFFWCQELQATFAAISHHHPAGGEGSVIPTHPEAPATLAA